MIQDIDLQKFIDTVFNKYDHDRSGQLNTAEIALFFNDVFASMGQSTRLNNQQAQQALSAIDQNRDGMANLN